VRHEKGCDANIAQRVPEEPETQRQLSARFGHTLLPSELAARCVRSRVMPGGLRSLELRYSFLENRRRHTYEKAELSA